MCGIAGFSLNPNEPVNAKKLAKAMLLDIESRGGDATGFAYRDATGAFQVHKDDMTASKFVQRRLCIDKAATTAILHTRFATQGHQQYNENNHPILHGHVVGVHNGHVGNDDVLFKELAHVLGTNPRIGEVDSEAIFACLNWYDAPTTEILEAVRGGAAIAWLDNEDETPNALHLARLNDSPLVVAETLGGSVLFASTASAVIDGAKAVGLELSAIRHIDEGVYITVLAGEYVDVRTFKPAPKSYRTYSRNVYNYNAWDNDEYESWGTGGIVVPAGAKAHTPLDERLDAESVDEAIAEYDALKRQQDDDYREWWKNNQAVVKELGPAAADLAPDSLDNAISLDAEREKRREQSNQRKFDRFLNAPRVNSYYIENALFPFKPMSESEYLSFPAHVAREFEIEKWANAIRCSSEAARTQVVTNMGGIARPGDAVQVEIDGRHYVGCIMEVPNTFPGGEFLVRAYIHHDKRPGNYEAVVVSRKYWEMTRINDDFANVTIKENANA